MTFDLSRVEFSAYDLKNKIQIPREPSEDLAYLIGIHVGDGSMNVYKNRHLYSVRGHKIDDKEHYIQVIKPLFKKVYNMDFNLREFGDVFGFQFASKAVVTFENRVLGLPFGPKKEVEMPLVFLDNQKLATAVVRGLFDTDGCVYLENKRGKAYPRLEITTTSSRLVSQIKAVLLRNNIQSFVWKVERENWRPCFRIRVSGYTGLEKWLQIVGMNNPKHLKKVAPWVGFEPTTSRLTASRPTRVTCRIARSTAELPGLIKNYNNEG